MRHAGVVALLATAVSATLLSVVGTTPAAAAMVPTGARVVPVDLPVLDFLAPTNPANEPATGRRTASGSAWASSPATVRQLGAAWNELVDRATVSWLLPEGDDTVSAYVISVDGEALGRLEAIYTAAEIRGLPDGQFTVGVSPVDANGVSGPVAEVALAVNRPPVDDDFAGRIELEGSTGSVPGSNLLATAEPDDPVAPSPDPAVGGATVWYSWTAPFSGQVEMETRHVYYRRDTTLAAYTGETPADLDRVAGADNKGFGNYQSRVVFGVEAGRTYTVVVDGFVERELGTGFFWLVWELHAPAKPTMTSLVAEVSGRAVTLVSHATSEAGPPGGRIEFLDGPNHVGSAEIVAGRAMLTLPRVTGGAHAYSAMLWPYDEWSYERSTSEPRTVTLPASTTAARLVKRSDDDDEAVFRVEVTSPDGTPTGSVALYDVSATGGPLALGPLDHEGWVELSLTDIPGGLHSYRAVFVPDDERFASSESDTVPLAVFPLRTRTALEVTVTRRTVRIAADVAVSADPDLAAALELDLSPPSGTLYITEGLRTVGTEAVVDGRAELEFTALGAGTHVYSVIFFSSSQSYLYSASGAEAVVAVEPTGSATELSARATGSTVTLKAVVSTDDEPPSGVVEFRDSGRLVGTADVGPEGRVLLRLSRVAAGRHRYVARFVPSSGEQRGSESSRHTLTVATPPVLASRTTITAPPTAITGSRVVVRVVVLRGTSAATGTVSVTDGRRRVRATLRNGVAVIRLSVTQVGTVRLTASFASNPTTAASSATTTVRVRRK